MKSTPQRPETIILLTASPTGAAPYPAHHDARLQFPQFGGFQIDSHLWPHDVGRPPAPVNSRLLLFQAVPRRRRRDPNSAELKNFPSTIDQPGRHSLASRRPPMQSLDDAVRNVRCPPPAGYTIRPTAAAESGALGRFGQTPRRQADGRCRILIRDDRARQRREGLSSGDAPASTEPPTGVNRKPGALQSIADEFEYFFNARTDDAHQFGFGNVAWVVHIVLADAMDRDCIALVGGRGDTGAIERFQTFRVGDADRLIRAQCPL